MAIQALEMASGAGGRVRVTLRYDDVTMEIVSVGAVNQTTRDATLTLLHVPSGVSRACTMPAGFSGTRSLPDRWKTVLDDNGVTWIDLAVSVSFWLGD